MTKAEVGDDERLAISSWIGWRVVSYSPAAVGSITESVVVDSEQLRRQGNESHCE